MKRVGCLLLCLALALSLGARADNGAQRVVVLKLGSPRMAVDSQVVPVDSDNDGVFPVAENNRTLVPVSRIVAAFGGTSHWDSATNDTAYALGSREVRHRIGSDQVQVSLGNGRWKSQTMETPSKAMNNRTYVPVRYVLEGLDLTVNYEPKDQLVIVSDGPLGTAELRSLPQCQALLKALAPKTDPISTASSSYSLPSGSVSARVVWVDMNDPRVSAKVAMVNNKLNTTAPFSDICAAAQADVVVNGNFFEAYQTVKDPIGHVMSDGEFLYGLSGLTSVGFTADGQVRFGRPPMFFRVKTVDNGTPQNWAAFEVNDLKQFENQSVLYTPARGSTAPVTYPGAALTVEMGVTTQYVPVSPGDTMYIPENGFVLYSSTQVMSTHWYQEPQLGRQVVIEPYLAQADEEGFDLTGVTQMVSGAPRLVKDGQMETYVEPAYAKDSRFTGGAASRTLLGVTADNRLVIAVTPSATTQQSRELMLSLGCEDAVNLDGGSSVGLYYRGKILSNPGRQLTTTLQIFFDKD